MEGTLHWLHSTGSQPQVTTTGSRMLPASVKTILEGLPPSLPSICNVMFTKTKNCQESTNLTLKAHFPFPAPPAVYKLFLNYPVPATTSMTIPPPSPSSFPLPLPHKDHHQYTEHRSYEQRDGQEGSQNNNDE